MCYCTRTSRCTADDRCVNRTSTDICFVRVVLDINNNKEYEYGCVDYREDFGNLRQQCLEGGILSDRTSIKCCDNSDLCNERLQLPLPHEYVDRTTSPDPTTSTSVGPIARRGMGLDLEQVWDWDVIKVFHTFQCNKGTSLFMAV